MIAIIDYSAGNLRNVVNAVHSLGYQAVVTTSPADVDRADAVILPGVGAFDSAARVLQAQGLDEALSRVLAAGRPLLGICLGLQLFFASSEEGGRERGLDILPGRVLRLPAGVKVPHMGWNQVTPIGGDHNGLFAGIPPNTFFYFAHSYYAQPADTSLVTARTDYNISLAAALARDHLWGVQFHPEKSGRWGLKLLENFIRLSRGGMTKCS